MKRLWLSPPWTGDRERTLLLEALESNWIAPLGPHVDAFESEVAERAGTEHAAALSSGTAALHLALVVLGVGPGDEVIAPTLTFAATAFPITYVGATPVFVDSEACSWQLSPDLLEQELEACGVQGRPPAAVIAVDLYGQCVNYDRVREICARHNVPLIEDAAEALGSSYRSRPAGSFGEMGIFSFNGNKIITSSGGGMLVSDNGELVERARFLSTQARDSAPHYQHSTIGYNYRMSNVLAALGRAQLESLDERIRRRRYNFAHYRMHLEHETGIAFMPEPDWGESNRWLSCIVVDANEFGADRETVRVHLEQQNIECRPIWKPMHMQPVFSHCRVRGGGTAERLFRDGLCLPSGSDLEDADLDRVVQAIRTVPRNLR